MTGSIRKTTLMLAALAALASVLCGASAQSLRMDIGNDTYYEWSAPLSFTGPQRLSISAIVNHFVSGGCACQGCILDQSSGNCTVPIVFEADSQGNLTVNDVSITFESDRTLGEVGYGNPYRKSQGDCWDIEGKNGEIFRIPIPPTYGGGVCTSAQIYTTSSHSKPQTDDAMIDAVYRLLNETDKNQDGKLDSLDNIQGDPGNMSYNAEGKIGVQSLWGPVKMRLVVWA